MKNWAELKTSVTNHSTDENLIKYQNQGSHDGTPPNQKLVANSLPQFYQFKWESDKMVSCLQATSHNQGTVHAAIQHCMWRLTAN